MPSKILHLESPHIHHSADGFAIWYCGEFQCESLNTSRPRVQVSRAAQHHYLNEAILIEIKMLSSISSIRDSNKVYNIDSNAANVHLWERNSGDALGIYDQYVNHFFPQLYWSARLPLHVIRIMWYIGMELYHEDGIIPYHGNGIIPWRWNHTIPWEWKYTMEMESYHTMGMELYHGNGIIPYHGNGIIPWSWDHTME